MMFDEVRKCFLCNRYETIYNRLEVHHLWQNAYRKKADKYGLTVLLCASCHRESSRAAHQCGETMLYLHKYGQRKAMLEQGWDVDRFRAEFGANYLDDEELKEICP